MDKCQNIANNVKDILKQQGKTMTEFSEEIGISRTTLQSISKRKNMSLNTAILIADGLGIPIDILAKNEHICTTFNMAEMWVQCMECYAALPQEKQSVFLYHFTKGMEVLSSEYITEESE